jgi:2-polyprenyl-3-methyl-5-hydroxy-6-metoxy-1,4-benzoquinol methylase
LPVSQPADQLLTQCRVCRGNTLHFVKHLHGEYRHGDVPLLRCSSCGCLFTTPSEFEGDADLSRVNSIEWHLAGLPYNQLKVRALFSLIQKRGWITRPGRRFLDVGCALGHSLQEAAKWGYDAHGFEPEATSAAYARDVNRVNVTHGYFRYGALEGLTFDVIMLDNVLEHVPEPRELFAEISATLRPNGIVFLGVPPVEWIRRLTSISWMMPSRQPTIDWRGFVSEMRSLRFLGRMDTFGYPDGHVNYFSARGIALLAEQNGLKIEQQFHHQPIRVPLYRLFGITTGFWIARARA